MIHSLQEKSNDQLVAEMHPAKSTTLRTHAEQFPLWFSIVKIIIRVVTDAYF